MPKIKIANFGGMLGFNLRKYFPTICSNMYLKLIRKSSNRIIKTYINSKNLNEFKPLFISIETINRCNGMC